MHRLLATALLAGIVAACATAAPTPTPSPSPTPGAQGLYLRAWLEQALPPEHTFTWLPQVTIADGLLIDGVVAVPAIFPGPLVVMPNVRSIAPAGQQMLIEEARHLGLLAGQTDFTGGRLAPGSQSAVIEMVVDGVTHRVVGDASAAPAPVPGAPGAFALFWQRLSTTGEWMQGELGDVRQYVPERVAVAFTAPQRQPDVEPNRVAWPLNGTFAELGEPWALAGSRCATFDGEELEMLLPVLVSATQIDVFVDSAGEERTLLVRPLVPDEASPCAT